MKKGKRNLPLGFAGRRKQRRLNQLPLEEEDDDEGKKEIVPHIKKTHVLLDPSSSSSEGEDDVDQTPVLTNACHFPSSSTASLSDPPTPKEGGEPAAAETTTTQSSNEVLIPKPTPGTQQQRRLVSSSPRSSRNSDSPTIDILKNDDSSKVVAIKKRPPPPPQNEIIDLLSSDDDNSDDDDDHHHAVEEKERKIDRETTTNKKQSVPVKNPSASGETTTNKKQSVPVKNPSASTTTKAVTLPVVASTTGTTTNNKNASSKQKEPEKKKRVQPILLTSSPLLDPVAASCSSPTFHHRRKKNATSKTPYFLGPPSPVLSGRELQDNRRRRQRTSSTNSSTIMKVVDPIKAVPSNNRQTTTSKQPIPSNMKNETRVSSEDVDIDDGDSSSDQEELEAGTIEELKSTCWKCSVQLRVGDAQAENEEEMCCYAMHTHPLFLVPICCVCSKEVAAVEREHLNKDLQHQKHDDDTDAGAEWCSGCGQHEEDVETLFLCEGKDCQRGMCSTCVAQAYGGGVKGIEKMHRLENEKDPWHCPCCSPPPPLKELQEQMEKYSQDDDDKEATTTTTKTSLRDAAQVMLELDIVESKKRECEEHEKPDFVDELRSKIREELLLKEESESSLDINHHQQPIMTEVEKERRLQKKVNSELADWQEEMQKHEERLSDLAASLQEELESKFDVDLKKFYQSRGLIVEEDQEEADEPKWKKDADKVVSSHITQRKEAEKAALGSDDDDDDDDTSGIIPDDVEDLWLEFPDETDNKKVSRKKMEKVTRLEDERYDKYNVEVKVHLNDADITTTREEESAAFRSNSKVRRDDVLDRTRLQRKTRFHSSSGGVNGGRDARRASKTRKIEGSKNARHPSHQTTSDQQFREKGEEEELPTWDSGRSQSDDDLDVFSQSSLVLSGNNGPSETNRRDIAIAEPVVQLLKQHQKEAIEFMFHRAFRDLSYLDGDEAQIAYEDVSGMILAHNMGLGKTLSAIALIHALQCHPSLEHLSRDRRPVHTVLLVVPVNTVANWEKEFEKWTGNLKRSVDVFNLSTTDQGGRLRLIWKWFKKGGVLLVTEHMFMRTVKKEPAAARCLQQPGPDAIFIDEAHTMLKNSTNEVFKALAAVNTKRRICLTGSPFQNNLTEYFRLISYVKPGVFGDSERRFVNEYADPIKQGLASDASSDQKSKTEELFKIIEAKASPFIHRRDRTVLLRDLPPIQEVVLYVRKTKVQAKLYTGYKKMSLSDQNLKNFLTMYSSLRPIHNHPACLLSERTAASQASSIPSEKPVAVVDPVLPKKKESTVPKKPNQDGVIELLSDSDDEPEPDLDLVAPLPKGVTGIGDQNMPWWMEVAGRVGMDKLKNVESGYKVVLLLHILVHASILNEKVVVFSLSLATLDFLEEVLKLKGWENHVPSLKSSYPSQTTGGWRPGRDYLRLDGDSNAVARGDMVDEFNKDFSGTKVFLLSSMAGGLGINLCSANRVVLFDSHFNPSVTAQAIFRTYRYGQKKSVFVYRFLTEGSMEEKIYARAREKTSVGDRVIDNKNFLRLFSSKEMEDLSAVDDWVQCDKCEQWRMIPPWSPVDASALPDKWYCHMNVDTKNNKCSCPERGAKWYAEYFAEVAAERLRATDSAIVGDEGNAPSAIRPEGAILPEELSEEDVNMLVERDTILQKLLTVSAKDKKSTVISKHKFHDYLIEKPPKPCTASGNTSSKTNSPAGSLKTTKASPKSPKKDKQQISQASPKTLKNNKSKILKSSPKRANDKHKMRSPPVSKSTTNPTPSSATRKSPRIVASSRCPKPLIAARRRYSSSSESEKDILGILPPATAAKQSSSAAKSTVNCPAARKLKLVDESGDTSSSTTNFDSKPPAKVSTKHDCMTKKSKHHQDPVTKPPAMISVKHDFMTKKSKQSQEPEIKVAQRNSESTNGSRDKRKRVDRNEAEERQTSSDDSQGDSNKEEGKPSFISRTLSFLSSKRKPRSQGSPNLGEV